MSSTSQSSASSPPPVVVFDLALAGDDTHMSSDPAALKKVKPAKGRKV